ncbi:MAG: phosphomannomutase/phosphoglucomutase [Candidatus Uhrbacteria bacterium]
MERINPAIFKAYDIRGVVPDEITEEVAERVGRAVVVHTSARTVVVGRDMRISSPAFVAAVLRGVTIQGADAIDIGLATTPMFNYAVAEHAGHDAGIMVSASHNPARYNGFKLDHADGLPIGAGSGMEEIAALTIRGEFPVATSVGAVRTESFLEPYLAKVTFLANPATLSPMRLVVCCGNGMGGYTMPHLAPLIPGEVIPLHWELDGSFPNHEANPIKPENVRDVGEAVRDAHAAIGFAFDGDADRLGVIDERGDLVRGDLVTVLLARETLRSRPGATILYDVRASRVVPEAIRAAGGVPVPTRVGHALIKRHLREVGAAFAGELSGHFYFVDFYGVECTELAMLRILAILGQSGRTLSELIAPLQTTAYSGEINFESRDKEGALRELEARYAPKAHAVSKLDGLRVDFGDWWFLVRPSNTESLLRLIVETPSVQETERRVAEIGKLIQGK